MTELSNTANGFVSNLSHAVEYAERGWFLAPVNVTYNANGKKTPTFLVPWGTAASNDVDQVRDWYVEHPYAGIAIATKPSKIVGVDLDLGDDANGLEEWLNLIGPELGQGEWLETLTHRTPTGGLHLIFNDPDGRAVNSASKLAPGIDIRGGGSSRGGVLFAPPTRTNKGPYAVENNVPVIDLPEFLWAKIEKEKPRTFATTYPLNHTTPAEYVPHDSLFDGPDFDGEPASDNEVYERVSALAVELAAVNGPGGNETASRLAFMAGQYAGAGQLNVERITAILRAPIEAWEASTGQQSTWHATIENQVREGAKRPRPWIAARKAEKELKRDETIVRRALEFGDATIAEVVAEDVLRHAYVRTTGLGWLRWTGKYWKSCDAGSAVEAVRRYVKAKLIAAIKKDGIGSSDAKGWATYNSAGKINALVSLAGNMDGVLREASEFDAYPDLLNTPNGVLSVVTLELRAHDPELLLTKCTKGNYVPGCASTAFGTLLTAVPEDALTWLQVHVGQGVSGRPKPRVPAVLLTGGGRNGKSLLMETALHALGGIDGSGYAVQVPNELLLLSKAAGGPSPEKLMLRGARLAYVEETPEGRFLDVNALKKVIGTGLTSARDMYKSLVTFELSHILFVNTNHPPRVTETDSATWDRLTALRFPYRFRKPNDDLGAELPDDRPGDTGLAGALQEQEALDACLTWAVEGYRCGAPESVPRPLSVAESIGEWRREGDLTLRFIEDVFDYDDECWVTNAGLYAALQKWCDANGQQKPPPLNTFMSRLRSHTGLGQRIVPRQMRADRGGLSLPENAIWLVEGAAGRAPKTAWAWGVVGLKWQQAVQTDSLTG